MAHKEGDERKAVSRDQSAERGPSGLAKFLSVVLAVLIALLAPLSLLAWDIYRVVFNPPLMKQVLTDLVTSSDLIPVALEWYSELRAKVRAETITAIPWVDEPDIIELLAILKVDDWRAERQEVLPNYILEAWVGVTVDGVYEWIDNEERSPQIVWDMQLLIDRVNSAHGHNAIQIAYDALEPCVQEQIDDFLARLDAAPVGKEVPYNLCQFPDPWTEDQFNDYHEELLEIIAQITPQFHLTGELQAVEDTGGAGPLAVKALLRQIRFCGRWAWVVAVLLVLCAAIWAIRRWRPFGLRWGIGLLVDGVLLLVVSLLYDWAIITFLARGPLSEAPPLVLTEARLGVRRVGAEIFKPTLIQAVVTIAVAVVCVVLVAVLRHKRKDRREDEAQQEPSGSGAGRRQSSPRADASAGAHHCSRQAGDPRLPMEPCASRERH